MQILVKFEHFISYQEKYNTSYLDKNNQIWAQSKPKLLKCNELFDGTYTEYDIIEDGDNFKISFKTKSNTEYRFDIIKEPNTVIYHLAFSLNNLEMSDVNYEKTTQLNESFEVFSKLAFILKDLNKKLKVDEWCIGLTGDPKKDVIYEYIMRFVKNWIKKDTNIYNVGWALYFTI